MTVGLHRATIKAYTREVTSGTYVAPSAATQFVANRPGSAITYEPESLESDEVLDDIGASKSAVGKELVSGSHPAYLRHSGVEGQEPQLGLLYESILGTKAVAGTEYNTIAASSVTVIKVDTGEGANFREGQALLIKDGTNGYSIRNILSISGDNLTINFALDVAPAVGIDLGKAVTYIPAAQGHPTFSETKYLGNGFGKEVSAGNTVTECSITTNANGYGEVEFSYEGTKYYFNPIIIGATNKFLDFTDDQGTTVATVPEGIYKTPIELGEALLAAIDAVSSETFTVSFSATTGKFTIASTSGVLSLLWNTGTNTANSIGTTIGYSLAANDTGAQTYTSDNALTYTASYTPSYDAADAIIIKGAELMIGSQLQNACVCAQEVAMTISKEVEDVDCICEESGISEKIPVSRSAEMTVTATMKKHDVTLLDALLKNSGISAMLNAGPKTGGNWIPGKCFNMYMQSCTVGKYTTVGDSFIQVEITLKGYVTSDTKDIFLNFI